MRAPLREIAAAQHGAFSTGQALTCYTPGEVRALRASGRWVQVFDGTYRSRRAEPTARLRLTAASLSIGREVPACLHTAAELHGFGVLRDPVTHVAVDGRGACHRRPTLWPHQLDLAVPDLVRLRCGAVATTTDRTAVELACFLRRLDALPILDAALTSGACTHASLLTELARHGRRRGVRQARELIPPASSGPDSPQESRLRLRFHDAELPPPTVQLAVSSSRGRAVRWLDLGWAEARVGVEYDGEESHAGPDKHRSDRRRHNWLQDAGWTIFYATDLDVYRDHDRLTKQVAAALDRSRRRAAPR